MHVTHALSVPMLYPHNLHILATPLEGFFMCVMWSFLPLTPYLIRFISPWPQHRPAGSLFSQLSTPLLPSMPASLMHLAKALSFTCSDSLPRYSCKVHAGTVVCGLYDPRMSYWFCIFLLTLVSAVTQGQETDQVSTYRRIGLLGACG